MNTLLGSTEAVQQLIASSFLSEKMKRNYWQAYQGKLKKLMASA